MEDASKAFQRGDVNAAILIYSAIIEAKKENWLQAMLNRSSAYYTQAEYELSLVDANKYILLSEKPQVQGFILLASSLIKQKKLLSEEQKEVLARGKKQFPYHKKYLDTLKIVNQMQIAEDQDEYLDKIFEKLLSVPKIRNWMGEESFLTKVEKMITNPALASVLIKMDSRLAEVQQMILMAEE